MSDEPKGLRREPKAVTKPRVGNPWRESIQGNVNRPIMRVRGGAPSGMPVPSWQSDGAPVGARELPSTDTAALEVQSIRRSYGVESPVYVPGDWQRVSPDTEASRAYTVSRPAASSAESRACGVVSRDKAVKAVARGAEGVIGPANETLWVDGIARATVIRQERAVARWEALYVKALESGHASFESLPLHPSIVAERTRALQSREAPSYVVVRALPGAPMAHDPSHVTRVTLDAVAPTMAPHRDRIGAEVRKAIAAHVTAQDFRGASIASAMAELFPKRVKQLARKGVEGGMVRPDETVKGRVYSDVAAAVHPCQWCDSVACNHARRDDLRCGVYEWAGGDRGPKRPRAAPLPEWTAYVKAREAFKGPRKAHAAALAWIEDGRQATVASLHSLDARGVSIDIDAPRGIPSPDTLRAGAWRFAGVSCVGSPVPPMLAWHRAWECTRVDACHYALARWDALAELLASAGRGKVDDARAVLASVSDAAPRGVWWGDALCQWRDTHDTHSGAVGALVGVCRARRDTTVATVQPSRWEDTATREQVTPEPARASAVVTAPRKGASAPASAPRAPLPRVVTDALVGVQSIPARIAGDAPAYPVAPRVRKGDDASQCTPERAPAVWRDAPIEELRQRTRR